MRGRMASTWYLGRGSSDSVALLLIPAPDFGSVSLVESVVDDEKAEAEREMQKLTSLLEKHNVSTLREHLRTYETFTVAQILRDFFS